MSTQPALCLRSHCGWLQAAGYWLPQPLLLLLPPVCLVACCCRLAAVLAAAIPSSTSRCRLRPARCRYTPTTLDQFEKGYFDLVRLHLCAHLLGAPFSVTHDP